MEHTLSVDSTAYNVVRADVIADLPKVYVDAVSVDSKGALITCAGSDSMLFFDALTKRQVARTESAGDINTLAFSPREDFILAGSWRDGISLWSPQARTRVHELKEVTRPIAIQWERDGAHFWVARFGDERIERWSIDGKSPHRVSALPWPLAGQVLCSAFSNGAQFFAAYSQKGDTVIARPDGDKWEIAASAKSRDVFIHVAMLENGKKALFVTQEGRIYELNASSKELVSRANLKTSSVQAFVASPDEKVVFYGGTHAKGVSYVSLVDATFQTELFSEKHNGQVQRACFSSTGNALAYVIVPNKATEDWKSSVHLVAVNAAVK